MIERSPTERPLNYYNEQAVGLKSQELSGYALCPKSWQDEAWPFLLRIEECWKRANGISLKHCKRRMRFLLGTLTAIAEAAIFLELHGHVLHDKNVLWLALPGIMAVAHWARWISKCLQVENWYLDARALAKGMRVSRRLGNTGENWTQRLGRAVRSSRALMLCGAANAQDSELAQYKYHRAEALQRQRPRV